MSALHAALCSYPVLCALCPRHATFVGLIVLSCSLNPSAMHLRSASSISARPRAKEASGGVQDRGRPAGPGSVGGPPSALSPARD
eukprot:7434770-Pyramimonas_sp.AAC.1